VSFRILTAHNSSHLVPERVQESDSVNLQDRVCGPLKSLEVLEYVIREEIDNVDSGVRGRNPLLEMGGKGEQVIVGSTRDKRTATVDPRVAIAPSRYTATSLDRQFSRGLEEYVSNPFWISDPTTSVVSSSRPPATSALSTSAAACLRVTASLLVPPIVPAEVDGMDRSKRINSRGSSSNCSMS